MHTVTRAEAWWKWRYGVMLRGWTAVVWSSSPEADPLEELGELTYDEAVAAVAGRGRVYRLGPLFAELALSSMNVTVARPESCACGTCKPVSRKPPAVLPLSEDYLMREKRNSRFFLIFYLSWFGALLAFLGIVNSQYPR
jgi:hypothetical protein